MDEMTGVEQDAELPDWQLVANQVRQFAAGCAQPQVPIPLAHHAEVRPGKGVHIILRGGRRVIVGVRRQPARATTIAAPVAEIGRERLTARDALAARPGQAEVAACARLRM